MKKLEVRNQKIIDAVLVYIERARRPLLNASCEMNIERARRSLLNASCEIIIQRARRPAGAVAWKECEKTRSAA